MKAKIRYPLDEEEKQKVRDRLDEVLNMTEGQQAIILVDDEKVTDYYQNYCMKHLLEDITESAKHFAKLAPELLCDNYEEEIRTEERCCGNCISYANENCRYSVIIPASVHVSVFNIEVKNMLPHMGIDCKCFKSKKEK